MSRVPITLPDPENGSKLRPMIGAVIYVRVSTKEQAENLSLPTQLRACEEYYAYYHCQRQCRAVNVSKTKLEGLLVDELALLQPTPGYMRLVKDRVLHAWQQLTSEIKERAAERERRVKAIQQKLDRLDEAYLFAQTIDLTSYERQRDKLREELTLAQIDHHTEAVDELDVQGILAFAERILPRASDLWVQASLDYKQRLQQLFFPEGIAFDGNRFNRTAVTAPLFSYLAPCESADEKMVSQNFASWNQIVGWLRHLDGLRTAA